jgi:hypothetical protein
LFAFRGSSIRQKRAVKKGEGWMKTSRSPNRHLSDLFSNLNEAHVMSKTQKLSGEFEKKSSPIDQKQLVLHTS